MIQQRNMVATATCARPRRLARAPRRGLARRVLRASSIGCARAIWACCRSSWASSSSRSSLRRSIRSSLRPNNLVNLLFDCATVGIISLGIVCVLMLGEIDLSVGSMSGLASALIGVLWVNSGWPVARRDPRGASAPARSVGAVYAFLYNRLGMPSFIASLAGLLASSGCSSTSWADRLDQPALSLRRSSAFGQILIMPPGCLICSRWSPASD